MASGLEVKPRYIMEVYVDDEYRNILESYLRPAVK